MKSIGIVRKVDELGRIVLPKELRDSLNINIKDPLEFHVDGELICIRKYELKCSLCNNCVGLIQHGDALLCYNCIRSIKEL